MSVERALTPPNGIPIVRRFEDTGEIEVAVAEAVASEQDTGVALAKMILAAVRGEGGKGGGNGNQAGAKYVKEIKRHKWVAAIMALLLGPGGAIAVVYATSDRSKANAAKVESHDAFGPRIADTESAVEEIRSDIGKIQLNVSGAKLQQTEILKGIGELKKENITRMTDELSETKRLLRQAERQLGR